uniref:Ribosomal protein S4 n=1 Tax=Chromera velia TaxID=505693 RepID=D9IXE7_9ALVE|nr:ribosomal protein S4 [Chromera velia]ADJ66555.2 ribosomal protein S4 [Chromera velia]
MRSYSISHIAVNIGPVGPDPFDDAQGKIYSYPSTTRYDYRFAWQALWKRLKTLSIPECLTMLRIYRRNIKALKKITVPWSKRLPQTSPIRRQEIMGPLLRPQTWCHKTQGLESYYTFPNKMSFINNVIKYRLFKVLRRSIHLSAVKTSLMSFTLRPNNLEFFGAQTLSSFCGDREAVLILRNYNNFTKYLYKRKYNTREWILPQTIAKWMLCKGTFQSQIIFSRTLRFIKLIKRFQRLKAALRSIKKQTLQFPKFLCDSKKSAQYFKGRNYGFMCDRKLNRDIPTLPRYYTFVNSQANVSAYNLWKIYRGASQKTCLINSSPKFSIGQSINKLKAYYANSKVLKLRAPRLYKKLMARLILTKLTGLIKALIFQNYIYNVGSFYTLLHTYNSSPQKRSKTSHHYVLDRRTHLKRSFSKRRQNWKRKFSKNWLKPGHQINELNIEYTEMLKNTASKNYGTLLKNYSHKVGSLYKSLYARSVWNNKNWKNVRYSSFYWLRAQVQEKINRVSEFYEKKFLKMDKKPQKKRRIIHKPPLASFISNNKKSKYGFGGFIKQMRNTVNYPYQVLEFETPQTTKFKRSVWNSRPLQLWANSFLEKEDKLIMKWRIKDIQKFWRNWSKPQKAYLIDLYKHVVLPFSMTDRYVVPFNLKAHTIPMEDIWHRFQVISDLMEDVKREISRRKSWLSSRFGHSSFYTPNVKREIIKLQKVLWTWKKFNSKDIYCREYLHKNKKRLGCVLREEYIPNGLEAFHSFLQSLQPVLDSILKSNSWFAQNEKLRLRTNPNKSSFKRRKMNSRESLIRKSVGNFYDAETSSLWKVDRLKSSVVPILFHSTYKADSSLPLNSAVVYKPRLLFDPYSLYMTLALQIKGKNQIWPGPRFQGQWFDSRVRRKTNDVSTLLTWKHISPRVMYELPVVNSMDDKAWQKRWWFHRFWPINPRKPIPQNILRKITNKSLWLEGPKIYMPNWWYKAPRKPAVLSQRKWNNLVHLSNANLLQLARSEFPSRVQTWRPQKFLHNFWADIDRSLYLGLRYKNTLLYDPVYKSLYDYRFDEVDIPKWKKWKRLSREVTLMVDVEYKPIQRTRITPQKIFQALQTKVYPKCPWFFFWQRKFSHYPARKSKAHDLNLIFQHGISKYKKQNLDRQLPFLPLGTNLFMKHLFIKKWSHLWSKTWQLQIVKQGLCPQLCDDLLLVSWLQTWKETQKTLCESREKPEFQTKVGGITTRDLSFFSYWNKIRFANKYRVKSLGRGTKFQIPCIERVPATFGSGKILSSVNRLTKTFDNVFRYRGGFIGLVSFPFNFYQAKAKTFYALNSDFISSGVLDLTLQNNKVSRVARQVFFRVKNSESNYGSLIRSQVLRRTVKHLKTFIAQFSDLNTCGRERLIFSNSEPFFNYVRKEDGFFPGGRLLFEAGRNMLSNSSQVVEPRFYFNHTNLYRLNKFETPTTYHNWDLPIPKLSSQFRFCRSRNLIQAKLILYYCNRFWLNHHGRARSIRGIFQVPIKRPRLPKRPSHRSRIVWGDLMRRDGTKLYKRPGKLLKVPRTETSLSYRNMFFPGRRLWISVFPSFIKMTKRNYVCKEKITFYRWLNSQKIKYKRQQNLRLYRYFRFLDSVGNGRVSKERSPVHHLVLRPSCETLTQPRLEVYPVVNTKSPLAERLAILDQTASRLTVKNKPMMYEMKDLLAPLHLTAKPESLMLLSKPLNGTSFFIEQKMRRWLQVFYHIYRHSISQLWAKMYKYNQLSSLKLKQPSIPSPFRVPMLPGQHTDEKTRRWRNGIKGLYQLKCKLLVFYSNFKRGLIHPLGFLRWLSCFPYRLIYDTGWGLKLKELFLHRLKLKQKIQFYYNLTDHQLKNYLRRRDSVKANFKLKLLAKLELRLDSLIYRLGFAPSILAARKLITQKHILVNNCMTYAPNLVCSIYDTVRVAPYRASLNHILKNIYLNKELVKYIYTQLFWKKLQKFKIKATVPHLHNLQRESSSGFTPYEIISSSVVWKRFPGPNWRNSFIINLC